MKKKSKEKYQIDALDDIVSKYYIDSIRNLEYPYGEIDYIGIKANGKWDIYEVKSTKKGYDKAVQQLNRAKRYYKSQIINMYIYISNDDWIQKAVFLDAFGK